MPSLEPHENHDCWQRTEYGGQSIHFTRRFRHGDERKRRQNVLTKKASTKSSIYHAESHSLFVITFQKISETKSDVEKPSLLFVRARERVEGYLDQTTNIHYRFLLLTPLDLLIIMLVNSYEWVDDLPARVRRRQRSMMSQVVGLVGLLSLTCPVVRGMGLLTTIE